MKTTLYICFFAVLFVVGCQPIINTNSNPVVETQMSNNDATETQVIPTTEPSSTITPEILFNKISIVGNSETRLSNQCLNITDTPPTSNSVIVLRSLKHVISGQYPDIVLIDMSKAQPRETTQKINITPNFIVSPNGELIAYLASTITDGKVTQLDLIIADGIFRTQISIPWDDQWGSILGWTANQKVIISSSITETSSPSIVSYVLIDPKNGEQQTIHFSISDFMDGSLYDVPYWENWYGVLIDPLLNGLCIPHKAKSTKRCTPMHFGIFQTIKPCSVLRMFFWPTQSSMILILCLVGQKMRHDLHL
jgi:hypothetical protein